MQNPMTDIRYVRALMNANDKGFVKALGQNFLTDGEVLARIADSAGIDGDTLAVEIGPGAGALTWELCRRAKKVVAVELDAKLKGVLTETMSPFSNFELVLADALKTDFGALIEAAGCARAVVCANLPYYITTPVIMYLLESRLRVDSITVMIQREVAERFAAAPGGHGRGAVTVAASYYADVKPLFDVPPSAFVPAPKVTSTVVSFIPHDPPVSPRDTKFMFETIKAAFALRRKTLVNALANRFPALPKPELARAVHECGLDPNVRGEVLNLAEFSLLSDVLADILSEK